MTEDYIITIIPNPSEVNTAIFLRYFISREVRRATTVVLVSRSAFRFVDGVCLSGGAKRRHLSMTSTRHGAKQQKQPSKQIRKYIRIDFI